MIEILMTSHGEPERDTYTFSSCGHSRPEVCAAVSGLVQGVAAYLVSLQHECGECVAVDVMQAEGKIRMDVALLVDEPCLRTTLHTALSVLEIGIQQIQHSAGFGAIKMSTDHGPYDFVRGWRTAREMDREHMQPAVPK